MKEFEDQFSELQADMISICLEYVEDRADRVYVYASYEATLIAADFFYLINNQYVMSHKVNEALKEGEPEIDVSPERGFKVLDILIDDVKKIKALCEEYGRDMPTEMKLIYDVKTRHFKAEYKYDFIHFYHETKTADDVFDEWFKEVQKNKL